VIAVRNLQIRMGGRTLLDDLSFTIGAGEFVAILGRNGVGKTTLLRTLCGLHRNFSGAIALNGRSLSEYSQGERARAIAYVASDETMLEMLSVRDVVSNGRYAHHGWFNWRETPADAAAVETALEAVDMQAFSYRMLTTLSGGERQRCWLALALAQEPQIMLLDEPTSHLDIHVAHDILRLLRSQRAGGRTVVCVLHELNEALEFADRILILGDGRLLSMREARDFKDAGDLERAYGLAMESIRLSDGSVRVFPRPSAG